MGFGRRNSISCLKMSEENMLIRKLRTNNKNMNENTMKGIEFLFNSLSLPPVIVIYINKNPNNTA